MKFKSRSDGMVVAQRDGVKWCIDEHQNHFIVWCDTKVVGHFYDLETAKQAVERGLKMVVDGYC